MPVVQLASAAQLKVPVELQASQEAWKVPVEQLESPAELKVQAELQA